ncbi:MAG: transporter [Epsilonproteobacteria bacterium]|nr:aromatic hydrocarbon degradation protein [Campylobacterota bacterium]NPA56351.1 transporter [Campylobacterota bacterium]
MRPLLTLPLLAAISFGAAYKIPEQSLKSVALAGAYVAGAKGADAAYFNPANMAFMEEGNWVELAITGIYLPKIKFSGQTYMPLSKSFEEASAKSRSESFLVPHLHWVGSEFDRIRFGLSVATPAGLSKRWRTQPQIWSAEEFTLRVVEVNPSLSYRVNEKLSVGAGLRAIYSDGKVRIHYPHLYREDLDGDSDIKWGYNLALSYRLHPTLTLGATYRSKVKLNEIGSAKGYIGKYLVSKEKKDLSTLIAFNTRASVAIPLPATLSLAVALWITEKTQVEVEYERTFWSKYKVLDFSFDDPLAEAVLGRPKPKNWEDSNTFRVGITHNHNGKWTTMYGFAYDETPVPEERVGFELPDSDALIFSFGALYRYSERLSFGAAYLFDYKLPRSVEKASRNSNGIAGRFSDGGAHLLNLSIGYRF